jgi:hypothetical protein
LIYLGGFRELRLDIVLENLTLGNNRPAYIDNRRKSSSHELRLAGDVPGLEWVAGADLFDEKNSDNVDIGLEGGTFLAFLHNRIKANSFALFGQATYALTDALSATEGLRYTEDEKSSRGGTYPMTPGRRCDRADRGQPRRCEPDLWRACLDVRSFPQPARAVSTLSAKRARQAARSGVLPRVPDRSCHMATLLAGCGASGARLRQAELGVATAAAGSLETGPQQQAVTWPAPQPPLTACGKFCESLSTPTGMLKL